MNISPARRTAIIDALRKGTVPSEGLDQLAVGLDRLAPVLGEELDKVAGGSAVFKAVRGEYGSGKTFFARWLEQQALERGFAGELRLLDGVGGGDLRRRRVVPLGRVGHRLRRRGVGAGDGQHLRPQPLDPAAGVGHGIGDVVVGALLDGLVLAALRHLDQEDSADDHDGDEEECFHLLGHGPNAIACSGYTIVNGRAPGFVPWSRGFPADPVALRRRRRPRPPCVPLLTVP